MTEIIGILNVTRDSFSDGGAFLDTDVAVEHAFTMVAQGASIVDVGAESTHPDSEDVPTEDEIRRLTPIVERLVAEGVRVSVDTWKPAVMRHVLGLGVHFVNDVTALADPAAAEAVRDSRARLILMHSTAQQARARQEEIRGAGMVDAILGFFRERLLSLEEVGVARERVVIDPGMGFFLSADPGPSLSVLKHIDRLKALERPLCVSTSRKSFIGGVLDRPVDQRGAGTLATELFAWRQGVDYIRTHDVRALSDAMRMLEAVDEAD